MPTLDRRTPPHLITLVLATATGAVSMNVFLPSMPGMARYFDTEYAVVQLAVSLYLMATAVLQIFIGPASDRYGRRPVMIACFWIFIAGTVAAIFAPTIEALLAARMLQAFSAAGMVLARAVVRDTVGPAESASRLGYVIMAMSLAPMVGPLIGGLLDETFGWQSTFLLTLVFGTVALAFVYLDLGETNAQKSESFTAQFKAYPELLSSRRFWGYTLTAAFSSGGFFAFVGGGPYVATEMLHLSPSGYGLYFGIISCGYLVGNFISGRYSIRIGINRMMLFGNLISTAGLVLSLGLFAAGFNHPLSLFGPIFFGGIGNGMVMPNSNAGIVSVRPALAGSASGLGGAMQIGGGAVLAVVASALLGPDTGPYPLMYVMLISSLAAIASTLFVMAVARSVGRAQ
ncbi:MAG TPA: multidrug effflux MFS transporter [Rhizobiaceae bacterium]|nr:multidrug effflux MFS transporter [Rhizobiaceae bacterium]